MEKSKNQKRKSQILLKKLFQPVSFLSKCKSEKQQSKKRVVPEGCFSVYVGAELQKFVIKTECANHPLFKILLEDAELEYGFDCDGPIKLPCDVDLFFKILAEIESTGKEEEDDDYGMSYSCSPFSTPTRRLGNGASYGLLNQSRSLKLNHF
ncbi:hypothetical protein M9H77_24299 [Catharanthus roseus]|uniref:Uncharacterized protein n=1 Tax=Catharanthus roseus TaxID=4058 RepID=A0ACC0AW36_CATRO|nr:hypothetical protein M9H77_24299 [Catharanthus roseus]